jgi:hypothetical protein
MTPVEAANQILGLPGPIIFPDTCAIRDIFRSVKDLEVPGSLIESVSAIVDKAHRQELWIVASSTVGAEIAKQLDTAEQEVVGYLKIKREEEKRLRQIAEAIPALALAAVGRGHTAIPTMNETIEPETFARAMREVIESLIRIALLVDEDLECLNRANTRLNLGLKPGGTGGRGFPDCRIIENYLGLSKLCALDPRRPHVFVSSNRKDFCLEKTVDWHPDLAQQAEPTGLFFVTDFSWALRMI